MRHDAPASYQQVALKAAGSDPNQLVWWYVDGRFAGTASGSRPLFWTMVPGRHTASVTDAQGRTETVAFRVLE
jgi:penicillin-binding protein 1C